jgi:hypothetical protein
MATRESYLRIVFHKEGAEYIAGLELRAGDQFRDLRTLLKVRLTAAVLQVDHTDWAHGAEMMARKIKECWPDRAYFIEVGDDNQGWVQVFQPFGLPRVDARQHP